MLLLSTSLALVHCYQLFSRHFINSNQFGHIYIKRTNSRVGYGSTCWKNKPALLACLNIDKEKSKPHFSRPFKTSVIMLVTIQASQESKLRLPSKSEYLCSQECCLICNLFALIQKMRRLRSKELVKSVHFFRYCNTAPFLKPQSTNDTIENSNFLQNQNCGHLTQTSSLNKLIKLLLAKDLFQYWYCRRWLNPNT